MSSSNNRYAPYKFEPAKDTDKGKIIGESFDGRIKERVYGSAFGHSIRSGNDKINHIYGQAGRQIGFNPPPFAYLGPGNNLDNGPPVNEIDSDARIHDKAYDSAQNLGDVQKADKQFIAAASDHIVEGINFHESPLNAIGSSLGIGGIGPKYIVENTLNKPLYPSFSGKNVFKFKTS